MSDAHGRDHVSTAEMALDADGKFLAPARQHARQYGRLPVAPSRPASRPISTRRCSPACYKTPAIYCEVKAVFTNTVPVDAYRGAGRPGGDLPAGAPGRRHRRTTPASTGSRSAGATSSRPTPSPTRRRSPCNTTAATTQTTLEGRAEDRRLGRLRGAPRRGARRAASCAASASRPTSRPAASRPRRVVGSLGARAGLYEVAEHPRPPDRQRHRLHRHAQPRPGPRDHLRAARRPTSSASRSTQVEVVHGDTAQDPLRHGHLRQPQPGGRRLGHGQGDGQGHRQGQEDRRPPDGSRRRGHRVQGRQLHRRRHRQVEDADRHLAGRLRAAQLPDRGTGTRPRRDRLLRPEELHLSRRLPHRRGRDRPRNRHRGRW